MMYMLWYGLLFSQILIIYISSRIVMHSLFALFHRTTRSTSVSFYLLSLIYIPGTIVHELSHLFTSIALFVTPEGISIIPSIVESPGSYHVRFGSVHHRKTDPIRGFLIGSSPLLAGFLFFFAISYYDVFHQSWLIRILVAYLSFSISSTMFSSKEDMKEAIIVIPLFLLAISALIAYGVDLKGYLLSIQSQAFVKTLNTYLVVPSVLNMTLFLLVSFLKGSKHR